MTSEMGFECLLVSHDPAVFGTMDRILQDFSIRTNACPNPSSAANLVAEGGTDLIVIDLESEHSSDLMHRLYESPMWQKPTILGVSRVDCAVPGVHVMLRKPVTRESGVKSLKVAYSRMLRDYRKHTRFALMTPVLATDENHRTVSVTVTNIGEGGVGLTTKEKLAMGSILAFRVPFAGIGKPHSHPSPCAVDSGVWFCGLRVCRHFVRRSADSACMARKQVPVQETLDSGIATDDERRE